MNSSIEQFFDSHDFVMIPPMQSKKITFSEMKIYSYSIRFSVTTIAELGYPQSLSMGYDAERKMLAITPYVGFGNRFPLIRNEGLDEVQYDEEQREKQKRISFAVDHPVLVKVIREAMNWGPKGLYIVPGVMVEEGLIVFYMNKANQKDTKKKGVNSTGNI